MRRLVCPVCGHSNAHLDSPRFHEGGDNYEAGWGGRGDLAEVPVEGECGHNWSVCFGSHKGDVVSFVKVGAEVVEGDGMVYDLEDWLTARGEGDA